MKSMEAMPPMTKEQIARAEMKLNMTLDDLINMSKKSSSKTSTARASNKRRGFMNGGASQGKSSKVQKFMDSRSFLRQGVLAQRRTSFKGNQYPLAKEVSRKASIASARIPMQGVLAQRRTSFKGNQYPLAKEVSRKASIAPARIPMQGVLAQRRTNFKGNQYPLAKEVSRKAPIAPARISTFMPNRAGNWNTQRPVAPVRWTAAKGGFIKKIGKAAEPAEKTMDSRFANMKQQRRRAVFSQNKMHVPPCAWHRQRVFMV